MIADYCLDCVHLLQDKCDGLEDPRFCWNKETYDDSENCDDLLDWFDLL